MYCIHSALKKLCKVVCLGLNDFLRCPSTAFRARNMSTFSNAVPSNPKTRLRRHSLISGAVGLFQWFSKWPELPRWGRFWRAWGKIMQKGRKRSNTWVLSFPTSYLMKNGFLAVTLQYCSQSKEPACWFITSKVIYHYTSLKWPLISRRFVKAAKHIYHTELATMACIDFFK